MSVERINFTSSSSINPVNVNSPTKSSVKSPDNGGILPEQDKQKSNTAKWMIGATALAGIAALAIAGRNGHLGEKVQKFLHGTVDNAASTAKNTAKKTETAGGLYTDVPEADKGIYGQDIYDALDPRNADDILSPYYKQKGMFGQDIYDPLDPLNKDDMLSPYYNPSGMGI